MKIEVQFSENGLFGSSDVDEYDVKASMAQFAIDLSGRLRQLYPDSNIEVTAGDDDFSRVDGYINGNKVEAIEGQIKDVWESWEWVISKPKFIPPDPLSQAKTYASRADGYTLAEDTAQLSLAYAMIALVEELRGIRKYGLDVQTLKAEL